MLNAARFQTAIRTLTQGRPQSPFAPIFHDFKNVKSLSAYATWIKTKTGSGMSLSELATEWKKVSDIEKNKLKEKLKQQNLQRTDDFIKKHLEPSEYEDVYNGKWKELIGEIKGMMKDTSDMEDNKEFFIAVAKLLAEKRKAEVGYHYWREHVAKNDNSRDVFDKLPQKIKKDVLAKAQNQYENYCIQAEAAFPDHVLPYFLGLNVSIDEPKFQHDWKLWIKLRRELKKKKSADFKQKRVKKQLKQEAAEELIKLRSSLGFTPGSEKHQVNAYTLFAQQTRNQFKNQKLSVQKIGAVWKTTPEPTKEQYRKQAAAEANKTKVLNKSAVAKAIRSNKLNALTHQEALENLNNEQLKVYKQLRKERKSDMERKFAQLTGVSA